MTTTIETKISLLSLVNLTADQLFSANEDGPAGFFPVGANRFWHGGIHLHSNEPVRALWDGEVVAYRITEDPLKCTIDDKEQIFSHSFVLLRHRYETPKKASITFYSLYMHLLPLSAYTGAQKEFKKVPSIFQHKHYKVKSKEDHALAIHDASDSKIIGYIKKDETFVATEDATLHGNWLRVTHNGIEGAVDISHHRAVHNKNSNTYKATPNAHNAKTGEQGINVHAGASHESNIVNFLPTGSEVKFKDMQSHSNAFLKGKKYQELDSGHFVLASENTLVASDFVEPLQYNDVINVNPALPIKAGDLIGYPGPNRNREAMVHVELFTDTVGFFDNPKQDAWGKKDNEPSAYTWPGFAKLEDPAAYGQDGLVDAPSLITQLDTNKDGNISADEIKTSLRNPDTARQLRQLVCRHPSEWSAAGIETKFARLKGEPWKLKENHYQQQLDHIKKFTFWEQVTQKPASSTVWHLHPVAFVAHLKALRGITKEQLRRILYKTAWPKAISNETHDANIEKFVVAINNTMEKYKININRLRQCHFLAQIGHESSSLQKTEEYGSDSYFEHYDNRSDLGNNGVGQGKLYKGRGLIQLTGCANYTSFASSINSADTTVLDINSEASLSNIASDPNLASDVAGWFWDAHDLNDFADQDDIFGVSKVINGIDRITGKPKGFEDRKKRLALAKYLLID